MSDTELKDILISSGITTGIYLIYKGGINIYKNYYLESECHKNTLQISVKERQIQQPNNKEEQKEEHKEEDEKPNETELSEIKVDIV